MSLELVALIIFFITYALIISERVHRTLTALLGGMLMILLGVVSQKDAFLSIDLNVIFLLAGMMMIAFVMGETGIFQLIAVQAVKLGRGNPVAIMVIMAGFTAGASALLDNVTVVVLIAPVTLFVASTLHLNPIPFLITEVIASNIGGAATLIGDPPNILIGSAANMDFIYFAANMVPPSFFALLSSLAISVIIFGPQLHVTSEHRRSIMRLSTKGLISDRTLLVKSIIILAMVLVGFLLHGWLHIQPATIALSGATLLLVWSRTDPHEVLKHVEWTTLLFFVGLFITVEALVEVGLIQNAVDAIIGITDGDLQITSFLLLWFSAFASGLIDNIPYTAAMIPVVEGLAGVMPLEPLWWALALGADFGGNLTLVGASANVIVASLAERSGHRISFTQFFRYGLINVIITLIIASLWIWWRYL